ncbi:lipocalin family protein [Flavobacterium sp.]|uniref:lipocalin family protein n=1 Tax=Flavobacterium sp. TaxID=239 RepID=UPI003D6B8475
MKIYAVLILLLFITACSKDDTKPEVKEGTIFGKWYHKEIVVNNITFPYDDHEPCGKDYIEFYDTNKIKSIDVWACDEDLDWIGNFTKNNNSLTINNGSETRTVEIVELTNNTFSYKYDYDQDGNGVNEHYIEKYDR